MKLLFVTIEAPWGHRESFIKTELLNILRDSENVIVFPLRPGHKLPNSELNAYSVGVIKLKDIATVLKQFVLKLNKIIKVLLILSKSQKLKRFLYTLFFMPRILLMTSLIEKNKISHIHAYWGSTPATCALVASELTGAKFSFTIHRADIEVDDALKLKSDKARFIRSVSIWGRNKAISLGVSAEKIKVLHLGVDIPKALPPRNKKRIIRIVCTASLTKEKMHSNLIRSISKLRNVSLTLIGEGPKRNEIIKQIQKLGIANKVKLLGQFDSEEIFNLYRKRSFDLFILASSIEGIPVSAIEAMAYSIPVATTKVGGTLELVNKESGYILKSDLSNIKDVLSEIPRKNKISKARKIVASDFNSSINSKKLFNLLTLDTDA